MKRVFVDTGAFFAHLIADNLENPRARRAFEQARIDSWQLITTNAVVIETYALLERLKITEAVAFDRHFAEYGRFALL